MFLPNAPTDSDEKVESETKKTSEKTSFFEK